jgi:metal-responsive CopG/Arc/MetJ family transcriptional regulator
MKTISVTVTKELLTDINNLPNVNRSKFIREAIERNLENYRGVKEAQKENKKRRED